MATVTAPIALDSTLQSTNTALTAQNALLTSANSNSLADVMEDGIANIVTAIGAIPTPTAANVSFDDSQAGLGESNVQGAINALNDNLATTNTTATTAYNNRIEIVSISQSNTTATLTFSGTAHTRQVNMILFVGGQSGVGKPITISFGGSAGYSSISDVKVSSNDDGVTTSGTVLTIPSGLYGQWGNHILLKLYPDDEITVTVS